MPRLKNLRSQSLLKVASKKQVHATAMADIAQIAEMSHFSIGGKNETTPVSIRKDAANNAA